MLVRDTTAAYSEQTGSMQLYYRVWASLGKNDTNVLHSMPDELLRTLARSVLLKQQVASAINGDG